MQRALPTALALATALSWGCSKASEEKAGAKNTSAGASRPAKDIATGVLATVSLPTGLSLEGISKAIDVFEPGASAMVAAGAPMALGQAMGGMDTSALDTSAPMTVVVVNPKKYKMPVVLVGSTKSISELKSSAKKVSLTAVQEGDYALVGDSAAIKAVTSSVSSLHGKDSRFTARIYPEALLKAFGDDLRSGLSMMGQQMAAMGGQFASLATAYGDVVFAAGEQTRVIEVFVDSGDTSADLQMRLEPKPGTTLAALAAAQEPSKHELIAKLPASSGGAYILSGDLRAGAAAKPIQEFSSKFIHVILPGTAGSNIEKHMAGFFEALDGRFACALDMDLSNPIAPKMEMNYLMGTSDAEKMRGTWRSLMTEVVNASKGEGGAMLGLPVTLDFKPKSAVVDGVEVDLYSAAFNTENMPPEQQQALAAANQTMTIATFDDLAVMSTAEQDPMPDIIAAARGKAPTLQLGDATAAALARSTSLGESFVNIIDVSSLMPGVPAPFRLLAVGFGKDRSALRIRISVRK